jgi:hypothetical protein
VNSPGNTRRLARLSAEPKIAHGDGSFSRRLAQLAKMGVLRRDDRDRHDLDQGARKLRSIPDLAAVGEGYGSFDGSRNAAKGSRCNNPCQRDC